MLLQLSVYEILALVNVLRGQRLVLELDLPRNALCLVRALDIVVHILDYVAAEIG